MRDWQLQVKRAFDLVVAGGALVASAPVLAVAAAAVRVSMGRPVVFHQARAGHRGRIFTIYKLRTMAVDARTGENVVTPLGAFLRRTSIDELPQLWNVVLGDMSLVGPRPLLPEYLPLYTPRHSRRHEVRPGITGWAQVQGRNSQPLSVRREQDVWYVENWSLALDARILLSTVKRVLRRDGMIASPRMEDVDDLGFARALRDRSTSAASPHSGPAPVPTNADRPTA